MKTGTWFYDQQKLLHTALHFQMPTLSILPIDTFSKCGMCSVLNVLVSGCCTSAKTQPPHKMPTSVTKQQQQKKWPSTANLYFHRGKTTRRLITLHRHVSYCSWRCVFAHEIGSQGTWRISIKILVNQWLAVTTKAAHDGNCIPPEQYGLLHTDSKELTNALYMSEVAQKSLNLSTDVTMDWSLAWFWN